MIEKGFLIYNKDYRVSIRGGQLWRIPPHEKTGGITRFDKAARKLSIFLRPDSEYEEVQKNLYTIVRNLNPVLYYILWIRQRLPSLLLLIPISLTVMFFGYMTVYGDLVINWAFLGENSMTVFGLPMHQAAIVTGIIAALIIYFFPVIFSGEQENFIKALNERFSSREQLRKRLAATTRFLKSKQYVNSVEVWNPDLTNEELDWVERSLIPALFDAGLEMVYHIRIDERHILENYIHEIVDRQLIWEDQAIQPGDQQIPDPIGYEYLESWEKNMLAVYVFASTASLSDRWLTLTGTESDGVLNNVVSLRLVQVIVNRFKERLFSEKDQKRLISPGLFASRCLNDYGILSPALDYDNDIWPINERIVGLELQKVKREMRFLVSFLQVELNELTGLLKDPVAAIKLNETLESNTIYDRDRLNAIRFFIDVIIQSEQYKIFKRYWRLIIGNSTNESEPNEEIYRIIGVDQLLKLTTIFERAAMYEEALDALDYVEAIFPFKGKIGKARVHERQGKFDQAVATMLQIRDCWKSDQIQLTAESVVDLNLDIAWVIVSGRLEELRQTGREACKDASNTLEMKFDMIRDSNRAFQLLNVLANYAEWEGKPQEALNNYRKALRIPGVHQAKLSNLFVNKGIALRQMKLLKESVAHIEKGVLVKSAIGDADQLPVALHNLAQSCIELAFATEDKTSKAKLLSKATQHVQLGLHIQNQTGSVKKRGQLLAEKFVSEFELAKLDQASNADPQISLQAAQEWLRNESAAGRGTSYDCKVVVGQLFNYLDEFKGSTLEEVIAWQGLLTKNQTKSF